MGNAAPPIKRRREEPHCACNVRFIPARAVPHSGQAYHALSALACASRLVGLYERGRVVTGEVLDEIA
jgi:hypothetical protein